MKLKHSIFFLTNTYLDSQAKITKLVQRKSKLTGSILFKTFTFALIANQNANLVDLVQYINKVFKVKITTQGLNNGINLKTVKFFQIIFSFILSKLITKTTIPVKILNHFSQINVVDSTFIKLPNKALGVIGKFLNCDLKQGFKIQFMIDLLNGRLKLFDLQGDKKNDQSYTGFLDNIKKGSLVIFDLGYSIQANYQKIVESGAYFLTKLKKGINVYNLDGEKINLVSFLKEQF